VRGEVYRLPARGKGHEQQGRRYAVVLQPHWLALSTWIVAFTSTNARETSFRPPVEIREGRTLVMCDGRWHRFTQVLPRKRDKLSCCDSLHRTATRRVGAWVFYVRSISRKHYKF